MDTKGSERNELTKGKKMDYKVKWWWWLYLLKGYNKTDISVSIRVNIKVLMFYTQLQRVEAELTGASLYPTWTLYICMNKWSILPPLQPPGLLLWPLTIHACRQHDVATWGQSADSSPWHPPHSWPLTPLQKRMSPWTQISLLFDGCAAQKAAWPCWHGH